MPRQPECSWMLPTQILRCLSLAFQQPFVLVFVARLNGYRANLYLRCRSTFGYTRNVGSVPNSGICLPSLRTVPVNVSEVYNTAKAFGSGEPGHAYIT
jgi:hypothetical protein